ncbi:hypothetical protein [Acinetobacter sp.]|uniref:hypothetical protein n=1 Tax=Acinetobacter sp. TaxID=472 RepID=UPI00289CE695|nr:hypothetical protein [Acinetobacter sp.]
MTVNKKDFYYQILFFISCLTYAFCLNLSHKTYLLDTQEFWGYTYYGLGWTEIFFLFFAIFFTSLVTSLKLNTPSRIIIYMLYFIVFIPTLTLTLALKENSLSHYGISLICLIIGYIILNLNKVQPSSHLQLLPSKKVEIIFIAFFIFCFFSLFFIFRNIINFVGLDEIYTQRELGRSSNLFQGYMLTYLPNVICSALMAFGLIKNRKIYILMAFAGYLLIFGISAQRAVFLMPFIIILLFYYLKNNDFKKNYLILFNLFVCLTFVFISYLPPSSLREFLGFYFLTRIFATPGIMFSLYHDVFIPNNLTYWSHIKGFSLVIEKPSAFIYESDWPQLGWIVAKYKLGIVSNSNANLFAADGLAAAGGLGIIILCIIFYFYLFIFDYLTKNINTVFKVLVAFPIGLALTNGSLATILLSFGGLFWLLLFAYLKTNKAYQ